ncbi:hypothetical protein V8F20_006875 [Naviculisporaceae sp. PSN 640]
MEGPNTRYDAPAKRRRSFRCFQFVYLVGPPHKIITCNLPLFLFYPHFLVARQFTFLLVVSSNSSIKTLLAFLLQASSRKFQVFSQLQDAKVWQHLHHRGRRRHR